MSALAEEVERQRYPVGRFQLTQQVTAEQRRQAIDFLEAFPRLFRQEVEMRGDAGLERPYRPDGWTLRQLAHHVADSHSQMSGRLRMALTEDWPMIKAYDQEAWANLADARSAPVAVSLAIIEGVHARMVILLRSLKDTDWARGFNHPENGPERIDQVLLRYEWHSRHHLEHARAVPR
ncbi:MAG TPA: putative metal-dependent hydrolase [Acidobacteriaceae bacterium]